MALFLNESEVRGLLTMKECIGALETAFMHASNGLAENVPRKRIRLPRGFLHVMSAAAVASDMTGFGYKAYTTFPRGESKFLMMLYDSENGGLLSVMEAGNLGQIRTRSSLRSGHQINGFRGRRDRRDNRHRIPGQEPIGGCMRGPVCKEYSCLQS